MIEINDHRLINLRGKNSSYVLRITETNHLEHIYYGKRLNHVDQSEKAIVEKNLTRALPSLSFDERHPTLDLNNMCLEASFEGKGDFKEPLIRIKGIKTLDFRYSGHRAYPGIRRYKKAHLPMAVAEEFNAETLEILLKESTHDISIILCYTLFKDWDIITRKTIIRNDGDNEIEIDKCASMQLDLHGSSFTLVSLAGAWLREMREERRLIGQEKITLSSRNMSTGFENNNVFALLYGKGECIISGLLYSSDFSTSFEQSPYSKLHIISGINPECFSYRLAPSEEFESPESILFYSDEGLEEGSELFKRGVEKLIMRGPWKERLRPVTLSTRDIFSLDVDENKIEQLSRAAKAMGFEAIVLDDGWFGVRRERNTSLGDWYVNSMKFPSGLKMLAQNIHRDGLLFGLYFDIETVSQISNFYKEKNEWIIGSKDRKNYSSNEGDFILDYTKEEVQEWVIDTLSLIIETTKLDYLRYEKTRLPSEINVDYPEEFAHKYIMGIYNVLNTIARKFPNMIIETSASGGCRFDLGMLNYSALMRVTENTDPISRIKTIEGARLFYPVTSQLITISGSPDKITRKETDIETRFNASVFCIPEYSLDIMNLSLDETLAIKNQIEFYKQYRNVLQTGKVITDDDEKRIIWSISNQDGSIIIMLYLIKELIPNDSKERLFVTQANENYKYRIYSRTHIQSEAEELLYPAEIECYEAWGDAIKWAGIALSEKDGGVDLQEDMRKLKDYSSRLYIFRKIDE